MSVHSRIVENYSSFGRCLVFDNGSLEAYVTIDFGPRIIRLARIGGPNVFFADEKGLLTEGGSELKATYGSDAIYRFYGGHRLWQSPEYIATTYAPDNDPVAVTTLSNGAVFTPPPQEQNGLQFSFCLCMDEDADALSVEHVIENIGANPVTLAPWAITQLAPGGMEIVPQSKRNTGLLPDRMMTLWPYTDMGDTRVTWGDDALLLRQEETISQAFKIALYNRAGWGVYVNGDIAFIKRFKTPEGDNYPDGGMNFETYTNKLFLEMETLGPLQTLIPGQSLKHVEQWQITDAPLALDRNDLAACLAFAQTIL